ncbi:MAG: class I SAM-dependent methyltransferase [Candidatus Omnitrophica bacterium]|nr:class I SAM-dependent methyltransferase [Candidatus Omnitrophota bacterium]
MSAGANDCFEAVPCGVCGADDFSIVYPADNKAGRVENVAETFRSSGDEKLTDQLVRCRVCGFQYLNPRLKASLVLEGYSAGEDATFVSQAVSREETFFDALAAIESMAPAKGRVLDVGTAGGSFLAAARRRGWETAGCEPNRWLCEWAGKSYGLQVTPGTIFDMSLAEASFDLVTLWDVLEHTPDPRKVLTECRRVLKPGGLLVVNYPDIGSAVARMMGRRWVFLLSVHLYYFDQKAMARILNETGFTVLQSRPHWQKLELDYILFRMQAYIPVVPAFFRKVFAAVGLKNLNVPYWMGQTLVIAK